MTLLPHTNWDVIPVRDRKTYKVPANCCVPGCTRFTDHAHHLWRRSAGTNEAWVCLVFLPDKPVIGNLVGLCWQHHEWITGTVGGHKAWIEFDDARQIFIWHENPRTLSNGVLSNWEKSAPLKFQPPGLGTPETASPVPPVEDRGLEADLAEQLEEGADLLGVYTDTDNIVDVMRRAARALRGRKKKADMPPGERRKKRTWTLQVPDDSEDGHEILQALVEECATKLGRGDEKSALVRYFVVVEALVFLLQHEVEDAQ